MKERRGSAEGVYRLGIRFEPDEKAKLEKMAKKVGCESIPMFVEYLIKAHEELEPDAERLKRELSFADIRIKVLETDATKVAAAHEEVLAQFRKTIVEMGTAKDRAVEKQYEIGATRLQHTLTGFMGALGIEERDAYDEGVRAIKELREAVKQIAMKLGVPDTVESILLRIEKLHMGNAELRAEVGKNKHERDEERRLLESKREDIEETLVTLTRYHDELQIDYNELQEKGEPFWVKLWHRLRQRIKQN